MEEVLETTAFRLLPVLPAETSGQPASVWFEPVIGSGPEVASESDGSWNREIFVVDDYPGLAEAAKIVLEADGYRVRAFEERDVALEAFVSAESRPAVLVTDYLGGSMSGLGLIKICKALQPGLKSLLVSGVDHRTLSSKELMLIDGSLGKPYSAAQLILEVRRLSGRAKWWNAVPKL
jgi:DNA-binding NtrC family response regulator